jgi:thymidylate synthase
MALPPCHMMFQCYVTHDNCLDLLWYQRSVDTVLGAPFNIASYALLIQILCGLVPDLSPGTLTAMWGNYHIYHNHFTGIVEMMKRTAHEPPRVTINWPSDDPTERQTWLETAHGPDVVAAFELHDYVTEPRIHFEMAV